MPSNVVFYRPFTKRGQNWLPPTKGALANVTGDGGIVIGGSATVLYTHAIGVKTGSGGVVLGGAADVRFVHAPSVASDFVVEWDFDNDGDFSESVEDITEYVLSAETMTGRDWPSLLTGKAGPGRLELTLRNDDDRFSYFNTGSPLATPPFNLGSGRKIRVRTTTAGNPDPALLAKDRFRRADGALGTEEGGLSWSGPLSDDFAVVSMQAAATSEGDIHIATVDTGSADYYIQSPLGNVGTLTNRVGLVYRYVDTSNYSICVVEATGKLSIYNNVSGVLSLASSTNIEVYSGVTVGVLVAGSVATAYLEGVPFLTTVALNTSAELAGLYALWATGDGTPTINTFNAWDALPAETEGILWTGDVSDLVTSVQPGPSKQARVSGQGWLTKLANQKVTPPSSVSGRKTGLLVGNILAAAGQISPPGAIDEGDVTTGTFTMNETSALDAARSVEETEFGFLHETPEGYLSFASRSARDNVISSATFSDHPAAVFGYSAITPFDWRREVFNRVVAGVSPWMLGSEATLYTDSGPYLLTAGQTATIQATYSTPVLQWTGHTRDISTLTAPSGISVITQTGTASTFNVTMPATVNAGDLLLILVASYGSGDSYRNDGTAPTDWTVFNPRADTTFFAKVAAGTEDGTTVSFNTELGGSATWVSQVYRITSWFGALDGIEISASRWGDIIPNAASVTPSWGATASLFLTTYVASHSNTASAPPTGYSNATYRASSFGTIGTAYKSASVTTEDAGAWSYTPSGSLSTGALTIAIRGAATTTPVMDTVPSGNSGTFTIAYDNVIGGAVQTHENIEATGIPFVQGQPVLVQVDDYDSQDSHNSVLSYNNAANLFASSNDATEYATLVLQTHAVDRPILSLGFFASKSPAYRAQALKRRVGDKISVVATNNAGLGISQDFFIESVGHRFSNGNTLWEVTWELSPA